MGPPVRERADAARNRAKVLLAAERLFAEHGVDGVSMDAVAAAAGVGKGTLFRRFGDKAGLAAALLDEQERDLQERMLSGPPPLGPGAPGVERVVAFVLAYLDYLQRSLDLVRLSETAAPGTRFRLGAYALWTTHVRLLLSETVAPADAAFRANALMGVLAADLISHQRARGMTWKSLRTQTADLAILLASPAPTARAQGEERR